jgi:hypothetical protein
MTILNLPSNNIKYGRISTISLNSIIRPSIYKVKIILVLENVNIH